MEAHAGGAGLATPGAIVSRSPGHAHPPHESEHGDHDEVCGSPATLLLLFLFHAYMTRVGALCT